ncbi:MULTISPECIES: hypothetical protein [unclassified Streptomyces]|uniref:hypothetical protein n=1 Tax=unclassified Streptomyces TaxID=2593676 RepID=UPI0033184E56
MTEPDFVVIRPAPDLPPGVLPPRFDGRWYNLADVPQVFGAPAGGGYVAVPSGRFEVRDPDGAVAEVWEVRWQLGV